MWIIFSVVTVLLWGTSDVIFKSSSNDEKSAIKLIAYNGIMLGICALVYMLIKRIPFDISIIWKYWYVSIIYIASMFSYYSAIRFIKVSIASPIANVSCAIVTILCVFVLKQEISILQWVAVIVIAISILLLSFNKDEIRNEKSPTEDRKKYILGIICALGYFILDGVGSFLDETFLEESMTADEVIIAFSAIYCFVGIVCYLWLKIRNREEKFVLNKRKLTGSIIETAGQYTYIYAFAFGDAALASPFIASFCVVSLILSHIFLGERLSWKQYILIVLIILGMICLSI